MSNKLIKNKNFTSKELEYYKNHCALLEKELEEERKKRTQLEITLSCGSEPSNHAVSELRNLIKSYKIAKETEEKLCNELLDMKKDLKKKLIELDKIKNVKKDAMIFLENIQKWLKLSTNYKKGW